MPKFAFLTIEPLFDYVRRLHPLPDRATEFRADTHAGLRICGQDGAGLQADPHGSCLLPQPPAPLRQEPAHLYLRGLFPREERAFQRSGDGTAGAGVGKLSGAAHRL